MSPLQDQYVWPKVEAPDAQESVASDLADCSDSEGISRSHFSNTGTSCAPNPTRSRPRKRPMSVQSTSAATSHSNSPVAKSTRPRVLVFTIEEMEDAFEVGVRSGVHYCIDIVGDAIRYMRQPLSIFLCLWIFALLVSYTSNIVRTALSPLCLVPGMGRTMLCVPGKSTPPHPHGPDFPGLVKAQGSMFDKLVGESVGGSILSIEVLKAEMATRDLSTLVRHSNLNSRDSIADQLFTISVDAKKTARGLTKLNAKVAGAVDDIMALNSYALGMIEQAPQRAPLPMLQAIVPIKLGPAADEIIEEAFTLAMDQSEETLARLVVEAEVSQQNLDQLEVDIASLHEIVTRENDSVKTEKDRVMGLLWKWSRGNRQAVRDYDNRLALLDDLSIYRKQAKAHVMAALQTLHTMSDDLEGLRDRVAAPGIIGGRVPLRVHIDSIQNSLERLKEGRTRTREVGDATARRLLGLESD